MVPIRPVRTPTARRAASSRKVVVVLPLVPVRTAHSAPPDGRHEAATRCWWELGTRLRRYRLGRTPGAAPGHQVVGSAVWSLASGSTEYRGSAASRICLTTGAAVLVPVSP